MIEILKYKADLEALATLSNCQKRHVACLLLDEQFDKIAYGTNEGVCNSEKQRCIEWHNQTKCKAIHAEINARDLIKVNNIKPEKVYCFSNWAPCVQCVLELTFSLPNIEFYYLQSHKTKEEHTDVMEWIHYYYEKYGYPIVYTQLEAND